MPVTLKEIDYARWAADAQTGLDLSRIYQDAPPDRLPFAVEDFVCTHLENGGVFCCAAFDERLLGAVRVIKDPDAWWLSHFCVRKTTRRRGVGSRLLALVAETVREENSALRVEAKHLQLEDQLLLARLGYRLEVSGSYFELNPLASGGCQ